MCISAENHLCVGGETHFVSLGKKTVGAVKTYQSSVMLAVDDLRPYGNNSRTHSADQIKQIEASLREFGFTNPILVGDDMTIIAGHGRYLAARNIGMSEVPCIKLSGLTDDQRRAYVIADNKLAEQAGWDKDLLRLELGSLDRSDFDLGLIGFSEKELEKLLADDDDNAPETGGADVDELAVVASCGTEEEQQAAYDLLARNGFTCRTASLKGIVTGG